MTAPWSTAPSTIHVNGDPNALEATAGAADARVIHWSLAGIRDERALDASAAEVFAFPYPSAGAAGLIDLLPDLEWLDVEQGVLLVIDAAEAHPRIVETVAGLLPYVADRWRSQDPPFEVFLVGVADVAAVRTVLQEKNAELDEFGRLEWSRDDTGSVPVVVHG